MGKKYKTTVKGIFYEMGKPVRGGDPGEPELTYYCKLLDEETGKYRQEKVGKKLTDGMTPEFAGERKKALQLWLDNRPRVLNGKPKEVGFEIEPSFIQRDIEQAAKELLKEQAVIKEKHTLEGMRKKHADKWCTKTLKYVKNKPSYRSDKFNFINHIAPVLGKQDPWSYTKEDVSKLSASIFAKGLAPATVSNCLSYLRRILRHSGITKEMLEIDMPHVDNIKTEDLTPEQQKRLLTVLNSETVIDPVTGKVVQVNRQVADMVKLIMCTGMRQGEVISLEWSHINFERETYTIVAPKGGKDVHNNLSVDAIEILKRQKRVMVRERGYHRHQPVPSLYVFPNPKTGKKRGSISQMARRITDLAGLPKDFRPCHGLRHWYLTELAASGVDIQVVSQLAGHKSLAMTQRYVNVRNEAKKAAVNSINLESIMNGGSHA